MGPPPLVSEWVCNFFDQEIMVEMTEVFKAKSRSHVSSALFHGKLALGVQGHDGRSLTIFRPPKFEEAQAMWRRLR